MLFSSYFSFPHHPLMPMIVAPQISHFPNNRNRINGKVPPRHLLADRTEIPSSISNKAANQKLATRPVFTKKGTSAKRRNPFDNQHGAEGGPRTPTGSPPTPTRQARLK